MFEKATRLRLRFETARGLLSVEDLWELPLTSTDEFNLNNVAIAVAKKVKEEGDVESFVEPSPVNTERELLELRLDILKHIIKVKVDRNKELDMVAEKRAKKNKIMKLIEEKRDEELSSKSIDELTAELNNL